MMFSTRQLAGFCACSALLIAAAVALPSPYPERVGVDPRTGAPVHDAAHRLELLRRSGDARAVRDVLGAEVDPPETWLRVRGLLDAELAPVDLAAVPIDPDRDDLDAALAAVAMAIGEPDLGRRTESLFRGVSAVPGQRQGLDGRADGLLRGLAALDPRARAAACRRQATAFAHAGRERAELRWLLRAIAADRGDAASLDRLVDVALAAARTDLAFVLLRGGEAGRDADLGYWPRRARLARWLGRLDDEARALERHLALAPDDVVARRRLLRVHAARDDAAAALPQARALAAVATELDALADAAGARLAAGDVDAALERLTAAAARSPEPARWHREIADLALRDLRVDRAVEALRAAVGADPDDAASRARLEELYRRLDRRAALADLLERDLAARPHDAALRAEVVALRRSTGQRVTAERLASAAPAPSDDDGSEPAAAPLAVPGTAERADPVVGSLFEDLGPLFDDPAVVAIARDVAERFPETPGALATALQLVDLEPTPADRVRAAARVAARWPHSAVAARAHADRAAWAGDVAAELAARRALADLEPADRDNRRALAGLLAARGDHAAAEPLWRDLVGTAAATSPDTASLVACLLALDRGGEADALAARLLEAPARDAGRLVACGAALGAHGRFAAALPLLDAAVAVAPTEPTALWWLGRAQRATGDAEAALATFSRHLQGAVGDRGAVLDEMAECSWALGDRDGARALHAAAVDALRDAPGADAAHRRARALVRLQRLAEAEAELRALRAADGDVHLALDHAEVLLALGDRGAVATILADLEARAPDHPRLLDAAPALLVALGDPAAADAAIGRALDRLGPSPERLAVRVGVRLAMDDRRGALEAALARRALAPDDRAAVADHARLDDALADWLVPEFTFRRVGRDRATTAALSGSVAIDADRDRAWLRARAEFGSFRGEAAGPAGATTIDDEVLRLDLVLERRLRADLHLGVGLTGLIGAAGDLPVGAFAAASWTGEGPFRRLQLRAFVAEPWTDPAAAIGLGGRQHGVEANGYAELGDDGWFASGGLRAAWARLDDAFGATADDALFRAELAVGKRLFGGAPATASPLRFHTVPSTPASPLLELEPLADERVAMAVWVAVQSQRLGGSGELERVLPIERAQEFAIAATRLDLRLDRGLGAFVGGFGGVALEDGAGLWNVSSGATWRRDRAFELSALADAGAVLGRAGGDTAFGASLQALWRW